MGLCIHTAGNDGDGFADRQFVLCDNCLKRPKWYSDILLGSALRKARADHRKLQKSLIQKMVENHTLDTEEEKDEKKERNALLALKNFEKRKVTTKSTFKDVDESQAEAMAQAKLLPKFIMQLQKHFYAAIQTKILRRFIVTLIIGFFYLHPWICKAVFDLLSCEKVDACLTPSSYCNLVHRETRCCYLSADVGLTAGPCDHCISTNAYIQKSVNTYTPRHYVGVRLIFLEHRHEHEVRVRIWQCLFALVRRWHPGNNFLRDRPTPSHVCVPIPVP